jgi:hypothetical protein
MMSKTAFVEAVFLIWPFFKPFWPLRQFMEKPNEKQTKKPVLPLKGELAS